MASRRIERRPVRGEADTIETCFKSRQLAARCSAHESNLETPEVFIHVVARWQDADAQGGVPPSSMQQHFGPRHARNVTHDMMAVNPRDDASGAIGRGGAEDNVERILPSRRYLERQQIVVSLVPVHRDELDGSR